MGRATPASRKFLHVRDFVGWIVGLYLGFFWANIYYIFFGGAIAHYYHRPGVADSTSFVINTSLYLAVLFIVLWQLGRYKYNNVAAGLFVGGVVLIPAITLFLHGV